MKLRCYHEVIFIGWSLSWPGHLMILGNMLSCHLISQQVHFLWISLFFWFNIAKTFPCMFLNFFLFLENIKPAVFQDWFFCIYMIPGGNIGNWKWHCFCKCQTQGNFGSENTPDSKVHGANMEPTWEWQAPCWPHEPCYLGPVEGQFCCTVLTL